MTAAVSEVFSEYEQELSSLLSSATAAIEAGELAEASVASTRLDDAERDLTEASGVTQSLALEAASLSGDSRKRATPRVEAARSEVSRTRGALRSARVALATRRADANRNSLFGGAGNDEADIESGVGDVTQKLRDGSARILDSRRNVAQTETIASSILGELAAQRATITRARGNLVGVDDGLEQSSHILTTMNRRALANKLVIYGIFSVILMIILWILYRKLFAARG